VGSRRGSGCAGPGGIVDRLSLPAAPADRASGVRGDSRAPPSHPACRRDLAWPAPLV